MCCWIRKFKYLAAKPVEVIQKLNLKDIKVGRKTRRSLLLDKQKIFYRRSEQED